MRLKNRLLYIHPGNIVLIMKILKKRMSSFSKNSLSVKTRNALVKKKSSHMRVFRAVT